MSGHQVVLVLLGVVVLALVLLGLSVSRLGTLTRRVGSFECAFRRSEGPSASWVTGVGQYGLDMVYVHESLESLSPTPAELTALRVRRGTPLLLLEQRIKDASNRLFEYTRIKFRGDRVRLEFDYDLTEVSTPTARQLAFG